MILCSFIGISDSGKSTITDMICTKTNERFSKIKRDSEERKRGITTNLLTGYFDLNGTRFYIIDSPGHQLYKPLTIKATEYSQIICYVFDTTAFLEPKKYQYLLNHYSSFKKLYKNKKCVLTLFNKADLLTQEQFVNLIKDLKSKDLLEEDTSCVISGIDETTYDNFLETLKKCKTSDFGEDHNLDSPYFFKAIKSFDANSKFIPISEIQGGIVGGIVDKQKAPAIGSNVYFNDNFTKKINCTTIRNLKIVVDLNERFAIATIELNCDSCTFKQDFRQDLILSTKPFSYVRELQIKNEQDLQRLVKGDVVTINCNSQISICFVKKYDKKQQSLSLRVSPKNTFTSSLGQRVYVCKYDEKVKDGISLNIIGCGKIIEEQLLN